MSSPFMDRYPVLAKIVEEQVKSKNETQLPVFMRLWDVSAYLGVPVGTLRKWWRNPDCNRLDFYKIDAALYVSSESVLRFAEQVKQAGRV